MKFFQQKIKDVYVIEAAPHMDKRGIFRRSFCEKEFSKYSIMKNIRQCNVSENRFKHTLRGFHIQKEPYVEEKLISCLQGEIYDVVVDLRQASSTYLQWISIVLSQNNRKSLYIPSGCANAFLTLKGSSTIFYYHSEFYVPQVEQGIRYDDPTFHFKWPYQPKITA